MAKYTAIGGQALIEGILMKSPEKTALAVRKPDRTIDISYDNRVSLRQKYKVLDIPVVRGVVAFVESLAGGYKAMMKSADISGFTELEDEKNSSAKGTEKKKSSGLSGVVTGIAAVLGVALAVVLFMLLPRLAVSGAERIFGMHFEKLTRSVTEQGIKLIIFVGYVWGVSFMKDIRRVFMYHGAEHKTIFCYEKGLSLTVENVRIQRRFHPRCGTSFMILMILVSIIVSTAVQLIFPGVYEIPLLWVVAKILMIPVICGLGFEILRVCGRYDNIVTRIISAPGMWLQRITTKEPEDDMIEVAIAALRACEPSVPDVNRDVDRVVDFKAEEENEQNDI